MEKTIKQTKPMKQLLITFVWVIFSATLCAQNRICPSIINLAQMQSQDPARQTV